MDMEKRAARLAAIDDCELLMSRFCYFTAAGQYRRIFEELWSKREDITLTMNDGRLTNRHSIYKQMVLQREANAFDHYMALKKVYPEIAKVTDYTRMLEFRKPLMANMVLEVAEDGQSAKGLWYTMGYVYTSLTLDKKKDARWLMGRHSADFVLENGEWRILNLCAFEDAEGLMDLYQWPLNQSPSGCAVAFDEAGTFHQRYAPNVPVQKTPVPQPYATL